MSREELALLREVAHGRTRGEFLRFEPEQALLRLIDEFYLLSRGRGATTERGMDTGSRGHPSS